MSAGPTDTIEARLRAVLAPRREVLEAYLFGSCARGEARSTSDVDVAVFLDTDLIDDPAGHAAALSAELIAALHENRIDLVVLNSAPPVLYHRVLRDGIRVQARDLRATTVREGRAYSRYCDILPFLRKVDEAHAARIARGEFGR